jgi:alkanesulfonate monooxygenase SsuD/methylene tetrahydromethanopterin reductase-like flavin-dependent oxidoreductase (luciferase family)
MGGPSRSGPESVDALEEAIQVIRLMWSGERSVSFSGRHYSLDGLHPGPPPAHDIGIWLGAIGPRMMGVVGRLADGWVPSIPRIPLEDVAEKRAIMEEAARAAGRDPARIRRVANVNGVIAPAGSGRGDFLHGPAEQWVEELAGLATEHGFDGFVLWPEEDQLNQVDLYARYVAPGVREAVH